MMGNSRRTYRTILPVEPFILFCAAGMGIGGRDHSLGPECKWVLYPGPVATSTMSELFGVPSNSIRDDSAPPTSEPRGLAVGLRDSARSNGFRFSLHQPGETGSRFTLARLIGDYLAAPEGPMLPATPARTSRRKVQRAFAQEFLYASEDLKNLLNDDNPVE